MTGVVRTRIAPSPTGDPHVGTAYVALFNYAWAKKNGGQFILRIEDTDRERSNAASERMIFDSLRWLGLEWDEGPDVGGPHGPYRQSERSELYREHAELLVERGGAYRCFCTRERLDALREEQRAAKASGWATTATAGRCPARRRRGAGGRRAARHPPRDADRGRDGRPRPAARRAVVRQHAHRRPGAAEVRRLPDLPPGQRRRRPPDGDHPRDPRRGVDLEPPKHVLLYEAFGWEAPVFCHMPLLRNADKSKISKRKNPVSLNYYRRAGFLPEALLNFLALMGWSICADREKFTLDEMIAAFTFDRITLGGPVFDLEKLTWLNGKYMRELAVPELLARLRATVLSDEYLLRVLPLAHERVDKLEDFLEYARFFFVGEVGYDAEARDKLVAKKRTPADTAAALARLLEEALDPLLEWNAANLEQVLRAFAEAHGWKPGDLFMPLRIAVTGKAATPPLFETMEVLGREVCRRRLRAAVELLRSMPAPTA